MALERRTVCALGTTIHGSAKQPSFTCSAPTVRSKKSDLEFFAEAFRWIPNIGVESVDATVTKARGLGASILEAPKDWSGVGRSATLRDPLGTEFALWQAKEPHTAMRNASGSFCWPELLTKDVPKAEKFYTELFGWQAKKTPEMPNYTMFNLGDTMVAGMMEITKEMAGASSHWLTYFSVDDTDSIAKQANRAEAQVLVAPRDIPQVGRFSVIADPFGASFGVIKLKPAQAQAKSA